jgi:hypothetical protein
MEKPVVILVQRSRRPRRWAGVAILAGLLTVVVCLEHGHVTAPSPGGWAVESQPHDSFESVLQRGDDADHSAQLTDFAFKSSDSTDGAIPTR